MAVRGVLPIGQHGDSFGADQMFVRGDERQVEDPGRGGKERVCRIAMRKLDARCLQGDFVREGGLCQWHRTHGFVNPVFHALVQ